MSPVNQNTAATSGQDLIERDSRAPDAPNGGGTVLEDLHDWFGCSGSVQESNSDLIGVSPHQLGPQFHAVLSHEKIEPAGKDRRVSDYKPSSISGHIADQAIDGTIAAVERDLAAQIGSSTVRFSAFKRHRRSHCGTDHAVHHSLSNRRAADILIALDIAGVA